MVAQRFIAHTLLAAAVLAGCGNKDHNAPASGSAQAGSAAAPAAGSGSAAVSGSAAAAGSATDAVSADLVKFVTLRELLQKLPPPPKAPANGYWDVDSTDGGQDGYAQALWKDSNKKDTWFAFNITDCRSPGAKADIAKSAQDRSGTWQWCFMEAKSKLKDYPLITSEDTLLHGLKVGKLIIAAGPTPNVKDKINDADVDAYLSTLDLAALSKM